MKGIRTRALAVIAAGVLLILSLSAGVVSADGGRDHRSDGGRDQRSAENTFTKWVTGPGVPPVLANMAGVVGGDVGAGAFAGEVMSKVPTITDGVITGAVIDAFYHFNGSRRSFTASVHVVQTGPTAVITGRVTEGWLKGNRVEGEYTQTTCPASPAAGNTCFKGTLDILRASSHQNFHLDKTCASAFLCTVQYSDFRLFPPGTDITYTYGADPTLAYPTIKIRGGRTTGVCAWSSNVNAICTFNSGSGRLAGFHLKVVVTASADQAVWYWDGTYWFGHDGHDDHD